MAPSPGPRVPSIVVRGSSAQAPVASGTSFLAGRACVTTGLCECGPGLPLHPQRRAFPRVWVVISDFAPGRWLPTLERSVRLGLSPQVRVCAGPPAACAVAPRAPGKVSVFSHPTVQAYPLGLDAFYFELLVLAPYINVF